MREEKADKKQTLKKLKYFTHYHKECKWLEEMVGKGWFLTNVSAGMIYTFEKGEPARMLYDMDIFNIPKKPTLEEIRHKEIFLEMAQEMGWKEVTHNAAMIYYFCKEYGEGEVNELRNDGESRRYSGVKFKDFLYRAAHRYVICGLVMLVCNIVFKLVQMAKGVQILDWFNWFSLVYGAMSCGFAIYCYRMGDRYYREMRQSRSEWEESTNPETHKMVRKLILTNRRLNRFLRKQAENGWTLTEVTPLKYFFEKNSGEKCIYTMDNQRLVNKRLQEMGEKKITDSKDWNALNNDWELQSVRDAEAKGWSYVCALETRSMIYKGEAEQVQPLNNPRYDNRIRFVSLVGKVAFICILSGLAGGIVGFLVGYFNFI